MGVVYRARDPKLQRDVAIKVIRPERVGDPQARERFVREATTAARLQHPGIATLHEIDETADGELYLVQELVSGRSLARYADEENPPHDEVVGLGIQLAEALAAAHARGVVHRDIKPANLMVTDDGRLKVLDFGIAKRVATPDTGSGEADTVTQTLASGPIGTPAYMAPEQVTGEPAGPAADVFSAGVVLYELAEGSQPFAGTSAAETLRQVLSESPRPFARAPSALRPIVERCLEKSAANRYASGAELADALRAAEAPSRAAGGRGRLALGIAAVATLAVVAVFAWRAVGEEPGESAGAPGRIADSVLIADVVNETDDAGFDAVLASALTTELQQSPGTLVLGRRDVERQLLFRRKPADTHVDVPLAIELARQAGAEIVLVPSVFAAGDAFRLEVEFVESESGRSVERFRADADSREDVLLTAVDALARDVRLGLGESLASVERLDVPLLQMTSASWEAIEAVMLGSQQLSFGKMQEAARLFELAMELDPRFAIARGSLALLEIQSLGNPERGRRLLAEAIADGEKASPRERMLLRVAKRQLVDGDLEGALVELQATLAMYPNLVEAHHNRGVILASLERYEDAVVAFEAAAAIQPGSVSLRNLWWLHLHDLRDPVASLDAAERLRDVYHDAARPHAMVAEALAALDRWAEAEDAIRAALEREPSETANLATLANLLLLQDRPDEALAVFGRCLARARAENAFVPFYMLMESIALRAAGRADEADARATEALEHRRAAVANYTNPSGPRDSLDLAVMYAEAGRLEEARREIAEALAHRQPIESHAGRVHLGEAYAAIGETDRAAATVAAAIADGYPANPYRLRIQPTLRAIRDHPVLLEAIRTPPEP